MTTDDMSRYYRDRAPEYEQIYFRDKPERRREIDEEIIRLEQLVAGKKVLELACGTGYWTQVMSRSAAEIMALDLSEEMLAVAGKKDYACPVRFVPADLYDVPFDTEAYDIVALGFWFSHHPRQDFDRLFDVLVKGLKPDGLIWMIDNNPPAEGPRIDSVRVDEQGNNYKKRYLDNGKEYIILKNYFSSSDLEAIFETRFVIKSLIYGHYYWSTVLSPKG